jgi:hypothetical protein
MNTKTKMAASKKLEYAQRIARTMAADHFASEIKFEVGDDLYEVLMQIDNMACGLVKGTPQQVEEVSNRRRLRRMSADARGERDPV